MSSMYYYLVAVASQKYHGREPLTYSSVEPLQAGCIVTVPLQRQTALGFVVASTTKPSFTVKSVVTAYPELPTLPSQLIKLHTWMSVYYPAPLGFISQLFLPPNWTAPKLPSEVPMSVPAGVSPPPLTVSQQKALATTQGPGTYVLHGDTGSGKTRAYIELTARALAANKSAIILTPEISLTSQLAKEFSKAFGNETLVIFHSQLTAAERRKLWLRLLVSKAAIVIGPRSALFAPLHSLGLIVIDEAHEYAYKQESAPYYHAIRVASQLSALHNAQLVLGSATPAIADYFVAQQKNRPIIRMKELATANNKEMVHITTVDMRNRDLLSRDQYVSTPLLQQIESALGRKEQTLLFINRRGTARIVLCDTCGWQAACPHCDLPLTYHHDTHQLRCHTCDYHQPALTSCPVCDNVDITMKSIGTKTIELTIQKLFPTARIARFDTDNRKGERVNELYDDIRAGNIDILVGTQVLAKGLDLPKLSVVGIINADASLYIPDFTAQERTYQLLHQLIGRVGRGHQEVTHVVIQTYSPDNATIQAAVKQDWQLFYETELKEREQYLFPPYCFLLKVSCKRASLQSVIKATEAFAESLKQQRLEIIIEGPAPSFHEKVQNKYEWQLIIKAKKRTELLKVIDLLPSNWSYDIDPINLL